MQLVFHSPKDALAGAVAAAAALAIIVNALFMQAVFQGSSVTTSEHTLLGARIAYKHAFIVLAADVTRYTAQIAAIDAADQAQEKARASAPQTTKQRNTTARKILAAVDAIAGAGAIAFDTSPTERALFEALVKKVK